MIFHLDRSYRPKDKIVKFCDSCPVDPKTCKIVYSDRQHRYFCGPSCCEKHNPTQAILVADKPVEEKP